MRYVSLTSQQRKMMLGEIGLEGVEDLFRTIPETMRLKRPLAIAEALSETDLLQYFKSLGKKNASAESFSYFLGAGAYHHFIPTIIDSIISRSEFYTAYTPYQPEVSQGTLQAIFEYQTLICQLTAMEVANASMYDGSSSLAESVLMSARLTRRQKVLIPSNLHPEYRKVLQTYISNGDLVIQELPFTSQGSIDLNRLESLSSEEHAAVVVQSPNFFGVIEEVETIAGLAETKGILTIVAISEAVSLGLLKPPGAMGADIVVGEGQSLGIPLGFGGPYLGFFATKEKYKR